jgi:hypothetical protein
MTMTNIDLKAHVQRTMDAALQYFVGTKKLSFKEFDSDLGPFLEAHLKQLPRYERLSYKLHSFPDGDHFDIGIVFDGGFVAAQLFEVDPIKSSTTFH